MHTINVTMHLCVLIFRPYFSITVQLNQIKLGTLLVPNSGNLSPNFCGSSSFWFGVIDIYAWPHTKCACMVKVVIHAGPGTFVYTKCFALPNRPTDLYEILFDRST